MLEILLGFFIKINESNISLSKVLEISENSIILIGNRLNENSIGEIALIKLSKSGNIIFSKSIYSNSYIQFTDAVYKDGKIYIIGTITTQNEGNNILFISVDTNGNIIKSKFYSIVNYEEPSSITIENDKIYIIGNANPTGSTRPFLFIIDTSGVPKFMKLAYLFFYSTSLKNFYLEGDYIYVFGDYYDSKRISFVFKFDTLFNLIEGKKIFTNSHFPIYGFLKRNDSLIILSDKFLLILKNWKILSIKSLSNLIPKFLNYDNSIEIFGIYNNNVFYYVLDEFFPILKTANIWTNNLKFAKNYVIFNSTNDYIFYKNLSCPIFQSQLFYLNDSYLDITIENFPISLQSFSIPFSDISLNIKDINVSISYICQTTSKNELLVSNEEIYEIYDITGKFIGKRKISQLKKGIYVLKKNNSYKTFIVPR
ncbi:MAG: hypothetical protein ABIL76_08840 [candidate division WOR-3 bacterium]